MTKRKKIVKKVIWTLVLAFVLMNIVAFFHAYKFTHFSESLSSKTEKPESLSFGQKLKTIFFGVSNPRPKNDVKPTNYEIIELKSNKKIECWYLKKDSLATKGTVVLFHGYSSEKSSMLDKAGVFDSLDYNVLLVDFMGSGGSEGNTTTIGFKEAQQVKTVYDFIKEKDETIYLFGTSMGAVAIMKALKDYKLNPKGIILECPFGTMYETVCARFNNMNVPKFPMAGLLVFWGGIQNGFWAFNHNPSEYAKSIKCPTLLLFGEQDKNVSRKEIDEIYNNISSSKTLKTYQLTGHENYLIKYKDEWTKDIVEFLKN